jgi:hypothetical protein
MGKANVEWDPGNALAEVTHCSLVRVRCEVAFASDAERPALEKKAQALERLLEFILGAPLRRASPEQAAWAADWPTVQ